MSLLKKNKSTQISPKNPPKNPSPPCSYKRLAQGLGWRHKRQQSNEITAGKACLKRHPRFVPCDGCEVWRPKGCDCDPPDKWRDVKPPATSTTPTGNDHIYPLNRVGKWVSFENLFRYVIVREKRYLSHRTTVELSSTTSQLQDPTWKAWLEE